MITARFNPVGSVIARNARSSIRTGGNAMRKINRQREQGIALLLSILCLLLLTAVAAGMMYLSATETAINGNFKSEEYAYFAAPAGVEKVRNLILLANANKINPSIPTS